MPLTPALSSSTLAPDNLAVLEDNGSCVDNPWCYLDSLEYNELAWRGKCILLYYYQSTNTFVAVLCSTQAITRHCRNSCSSLSMISRVCSCSKANSRIAPPRLITFCSDWDCEFCLFCNDFCLLHSWQARSFLPILIQLEIIRTCISYV